MSPNTGLYVHGSCLRWCNSPSVMLLPPRSCHAPLIPRLYNFHTHTEAQCPLCLPPPPPFTCWPGLNNTLPTPPPLTPTLPHHPSLHFLSLLSLATQLSGSHSPFDHHPIYPLHSPVTTALHTSLPVAAMLTFQNLSQSRSITHQSPVRLPRLYTFHPLSP